MKKTIFYFLATIILISCNENVNTPVDDGFTHNPNAKIGLIVVTENRYMLGLGAESAFQIFKEPMLEILSDLFNVDKNKMENMRLTEIIEVYGEPWKNEEIRKIAEPYYDTILTLTDETAEGTILINEIKKLAEQGYYIDLIFSLHGSENSIVFNSETWDIEELTDKISQVGFVRSLYQTCCYGSYMIDDWENIKTLAVNGSKENNSINIFSPIYFLKNWLDGMPYKDAVKKAYDQEIEKLKTYDDILPISSFFLTEDNLEQSKQITGGLYDKLLWDIKPVGYTNPKINF